MPSAPSHLRQLLKIIPFWIAWFAVLFGLYLLFASSLERAELCVGAVVAALSATGAEVVRAQNLAHFRPRLVWLLYALALPWYVVIGTGEIFLVLAKYALRIERPHSLHRALRFRPGEADAVSAARRCLAIAYSTVPPNFIILDILRERGLMLYHQISPSSVPKITAKLGAQP